MVVTQLNKKTMTVDEINTIRLALDTPESNRHYIKHTTDAKLILNKQQEAINYKLCCTTFYCNNEPNGIERCESMCEICKQLQD